MGRWFAGEKDRGPASAAWRRGAGISGKFSPKFTAAILQAGRLSPHSMSARRKAFCGTVCCGFVAPRKKSEVFLNRC